MITPVLPTYARAPLTFTEGSGPWLTTESNEKYLDLGAGIAVNVLGHAHPALVEALETQARRLWHVSNLYEIPHQEALARKLTEISFADTVFFTNSGTEAVELAIKMARKKHHADGNDHKIRFISFGGCFHGRSTGAIALSDAAKMVDGFGPLMPGFTHVPFGDHEALKQAMVGGDVAAVFIEPVQGEGGIRPIPPQCLKGLRELCDEHGALLVFDEIQCGLGRTGKMWAHEWAGVTPDIMTVAKALGGGFPIGATLATEEAAKGMTAGTHGSTYGGNPLGCAIALKVMELLEEESFLPRVSAAAGRLRQGLEGLVAAHPDVFDHVRGEGLMLGLKCKLAPIEVVKAGYDAQVITVPAGDDVCRLLPPLNISDDEIDEGLRRLDAAAAAVSAKLKGGVA
ncbi:aspartate aminotransferase family protein [Rhodovulum sp. DZ06]|uniref:aspartate aminotransferase family protein n=1 Tax=Rhodovulum sp. DZ06 TaxID=3425126 RepID=UPI003D3427A6